MAFANVSVHMQYTYVLVHMPYLFRCSRLSVQIRGLLLLGILYQLYWSSLCVSPVVTNSFSNISDAYPESFSTDFTDEGRLNTESSKLQIEIVDDLVTEPTECFICLILRPFGTSGIVVADPDTITICILDNDSELCLHRVTVNIICTIVL